MQHQIENFRTKKAHDPNIYDDIDEVEIPVHPLDSDESKEVHAKLMQWWYEAKTQQSENRYEMSVDADFYDGLQWTSEDIAALKDRGQAPLVFNLTAQHINWMLGTEQRAKIDFKVHPRKDTEQVLAQTKTKLLKYISDVNKTAYARSAAFADAVKAGVGWLEDGIRSDTHDEPLFSRYESWRNVWYDAFAKEPDLSDGRYIFRKKWVDTDIALAMFPDRKDLINRAAVSSEMFALDQDEDLNYDNFYTNQQSTGSQYAGVTGQAHFADTFHIGNRRSRVELIECWYRTPVTEKRVSVHQRRDMAPEILEQLGELRNAVFDESDDRQQSAVEQGYASVYDAMRMQMRCAIFVGGGMLQDMASPYRHDRFPLTAVWGYRRSRDNAPYGAIRNMRDPQEDLNKRRSKALYLLSTNQVIADEDAVEDWDELEQQVAHPSGIIRKRRGSTLEIIRNVELASEHVQLMKHDEAFLEKTSGVTDENLGNETNAVSGKAIQARQNQGSITTAPLFANLRLAFQIQGEIQLSLIEQFYDTPKIIRLIDERGRESFENINYPKVDENGDLGVENDITNTQADFVIDSTEWNETVRVMMFERMLETLGQLDGQLALQLMDLVFDMSDLPGKDEMVRRIRKLNGQADPDSPDHDEQVAAQEESEKINTQQQQRGVELDLRDKSARAEKTEVEAAAKRMEMLQKGSELAELLEQYPHLAPVIDTLFASTQSNQDP